jgi:N-acetylmuramoyl-L-alanine amidase
MAIGTQSAFNTLIAQSVVSANGTAAAFDSLTGGTLPDSTKEEIDTLVATTLRENNGNPTPGLYEQVAELMVGSTPGMSVETLANVLRSTDIAGVLTKKAPSVNIENQLATITTRYEKKLQQIAGAVDQEVLKLGLPGFAQNAANNIVNDSMALINDALLQAGITSDTGAPATINDAKTIVVNKILSQQDLISVDDVIGPKTSKQVKESIKAAGDAAGIIDTSELSVENAKELAGNAIQGINGGPNSSKEYTDTVGDVAPTIIGLTEEQELDIVGPPSYEIGGSNIQAGSTYISSIEELEAEMASMTRDISEIIVHWSETFTNANLTAAQLTKLTGAGDNAYHLIIRRDGAVERGVPLNSVGNHCPVNNHNAYSIGVCLVGGVNVPSDSRDMEIEVSPRSITQSQYNSLYQIFRTFFDQYPGGQALGHMDVDVSQNDPGFDVRDYVYNNFNKQSLYMDPPNDPALSPQDILKALEGQGPDILTKDPDAMEKKF